MDLKGVSVGFLFVLSMVSCSWAMMCEVKHPQTAVCEASYVIKAKILNIDWRERKIEKHGNDSSKEVIETQENPFKPKVIQARLIRLYKGLRAVNTSKGGLVYINYPPFELPIKEGEDYLLTGWSIGTKLQISLCDWFSRWKDLTVSQKFGIKRYYYWMFCACRIKTCYGRGCTNSTRPMRTCLISPDTVNCNSRKNICMVRRGRCDWDSPRGKTFCGEHP